MKKSSGKVVRYNKWGYIFLIPFIVVYVIFQLIPLISTIYNSFFENYMSGLTQVGPNFVGLANYKKLFSDGGPINSMLMQIGFIDTPYKFLSNAGSARGLIALMNCLMWFGNTTILLMAGMMGIDTSLFEAAEVDGATSSQVFWQITLPLLRPILVYVVITSLIGGLQLFDVPQILTNGTGDPMRSTMTLIMFLNKHLYSKNYGMAGALSVVLFIITGILSLVVFKITGNDKRKG